MRTFACFTFEHGASVPTLSFIMAEDEDRARLLVRRELQANERALSVDVYESNKMLWTERAEGPRRVAPGVPS